MYKVRVFTMTYWGDGHWEEKVIYLPAYYDDLTQAREHVEREKDTEPQYYYEISGDHDGVLYSYKPESHKDIEAFIDYERAMNQPKWCKCCGHRIK